MDEGHAEASTPSSAMTNGQEQDALIAAHGEAAAPAALSIVNETVEESNDTMDEGQDAKDIIISKLKMLMRFKQGSKLNKTNTLVKLTDPTRKMCSTGACFTDTFFASEYAIIIDRGLSKKAKMEERANAQIEHLIHLVQHGMDSDTIRNLHSHLQE